MSTLYQSDTHLPDGAVCELDERRWAVISFDKVEKSGLAYAQARDKLSRLEARKIAGLCLVTQEAAARLIT